MSENKNNIAKLSLPNGNIYELPIHSGSIGPDVIEIKNADTNSIFFMLFCRYNVKILNFY